MNVRHAIQNVPVGTSLVIYRVNAEGKLELNNEGNWFTEEQFKQHYQGFFVKSQRDIEDMGCFVTHDEDAAIPHMLFMRVQEPEKADVISLIQTAISFAVINHWDTIEIPLIRRTFTPDAIIPKWCDEDLLEHPDPESKDAINMVNALRIIWWQSPNHRLTIIVRVREDEQFASLVFSNSEIHSMGTWNGSQYIQPYPSPANTNEEK